MKKLFFLSFIFTLGLISCDNVDGGEIDLHEDLYGIWEPINYSLGTSDNKEDNHAALIYIINNDKTGWILYPGKKTEDGTYLCYIKRTIEIVDVELRKVNGIYELRMIAENGEKFNNTYDFFSKTQLESTEENYFDQKTQTSKKFRYKYRKNNDLKYTLALTD